MEKLASCRQTALVTGASGGIGLALARTLAKNGYDLVLVARSADKLAALAAALRGEYACEAWVLPKDLSLPEAAGEICADLKAKGLAVDVLVNNAGFGIWGPFADAGWEKQAEMLRLNVDALTHLTRLLLPGMLERGRGRIMNVGSTGSFVPTPMMAVYAASKAYVLSFSQALAEELRGSGVTVTALCPGNTATGFSRHARTDGIRLLGLGGMTAEAVAAKGYRAMLRGRRQIVTGGVNKLTMALARFAPRAILTRAVKGLMQKPAGTAS